ncbi:hypothetical protein A3A46_03665 [Candidatus Roizmanbacteria bacterium RIFCSPLOWO2_01_FULL_37_13]|uniref:Peptidase C39-like domain-containing protein n=1 Tax=Candidatus Roizmanbacteria bacterium RIFCSPHIGHO2_02_FULL_38_11 TaxID=1802039 RepID=A0A1F7H1F1_9BACT|nr:MAG: hypothetical protein A3C25_02555 [Candidatus Roizmanbacteria bacterium RIFCSPHIGHO2_02_FULL_38_11]OGK42015.1 MAG: hypothetical protein A3A46_03665 [Candidatus Roizmanbacteria bacterium RIFCSPLOWO2_01_FULL_37_13]
MKKAPPFVQNSEDDMHCVNAVFRMVSKHFLNRDFTWGELDKLTHAIQGKATWTFIGEMEFAKMGLKVTNIEPVDYKKLYKEGVNYLTTIMGKDTSDYYLEKSNISSVVKYIPEYLKYVKHEIRRAKIAEIVKLLKEGDLIGAEVNSRILNHKPGFSLHFVLLYDFDGKYIILHDQGLPPIKARKVSLEEFDKCFNFEGANGGITIFARK